MYSPKDIQFEGKHDFIPLDEKNSLVNWAKTVSVGIYKLVLRGDGKYLKASKAIVRVSGSSGNLNAINKKAEEVVRHLDAGDWYGVKTVKI